MQYIVGLNGPPRSGKDSIAMALAHIMGMTCDIPSHIDHLARPMRQMAMSLTGHNPVDFALYNEIKDSPQKLLKSALTGNDESIRRLMIRTSEEFMKPTYGQDFWARKLISEHKWIELKYPGVLIVPDIGFPAEVGAFDDLFPDVQTLIVQVERPSFSWNWAGDSRMPSFSKRNNKTVVNNADLGNAAGIILDHMQKQLGWNLSGGN